MPKRLSSIGRLPQEVLANILLLVPDDLYTDYIFPRPAEIMRLGHVSRYWREVSYSTPALWAAFTIIWGPPQCKMDTETYMVSKCLSFSRALPLSLNILSAGRYLDSEYATPLMALIVPHVSRWRDIHLEVRIDMDFGTFMSLLPPSSASALESLAVKIYVLEDEGDAYDWNFCAGSKYLKTLRILCILPEIGNIRTSHIPWTQLQHLHIASSINIMDAYRLLEQCTSLISTSFCIIRDTFVVIDLAPVFIPTLTSLTITIDILPMSPNFLDGFYDILTLPGLTHFQTHRSLANDEYDALPSLVALIVRSGCDLTHLTLSCSLEGRKESLLHLLHNCAPRLVEFELIDLPWVYMPLRPWRSFEYLGDEVAQSLGDLIEQGQLPQLQEFKVALAMSDAAALRLMRKAAKRRLETVVTLVAPSVYLRMRGKRIEGIEIRSTSPRSFRERVARWTH